MRALKLQFDTSMNCHQQPAIVKVATTCSKRLAMAIEARRERHLMHSRNTEAGITKPRRGSKISIAIVIRFAVKQHQLAGITAMHGTAPSQRIRSTATATCN